MTKTAKNRAEDLFHGLQKKAKAFAEAEEGVVHTAKDLMRNGLSAADVTSKLEELVGKVKANAILEKLDPQGALAAFNGYRDDVERRVDEDSRQKQRIVWRKLSACQR